MSRSQAGSPEVHSQYKAPRGTLPGSPAIPPVQPPSAVERAAMGRVFAEMGQALAETEQAPPVLHSRFPGKRALLKKPSREFTVRVGIGALALFIGWSVGAKPWQSAPESQTAHGAAAVIAKAPPVAQKPDAGANPTREAARPASVQTGSRRALATKRVSTATRGKLTTSKTTTSNVAKSGTKGAKSGASTK